MVSVRGWFGARTTVGTVFVVAVLSVAIGLVNISSPTAGGILALYIPDAARITASYTGALTGFLLLVSVFGLRRRLRAAWYLTVILLPVTAAQGLIQSPERAAVLVGLSGVSLALSLFNYRAFDRALDLTVTQLSALLAIAGAQTYATVGTYALREDFNGVETVFDAFYYSLVTGSTVGYGDVTPNTFFAKLFALSALLVTVSSFAVALGVLLTPAIEARLTKALGRMTESQLDILENHVLVLGYGELTEPILEELGSRARVVIVTPDESRAKRLTDRGYDVVTDDPSDEEALERTRVDAARSVVVATNNDAEDALAILTARQLNPDVHIVASATQRENERKLRRAGANTVISPAALGGHFLAESALGGTGLETLEERLLNERPDEPADAGLDSSNTEFGG
ncbi:potassium channel protein [Haloferax mediterranei ATCC 33500]|uniref:Potassium channel protein n=1 Tax=Haloferax mediterranei (strain ATCC 33500 / DSM 1411 / JCM 8866 / NBRC 14739 / NCIMB 2177 / R-4) TaxID=523841 RepID=I3R7U9_HALMT|nr:NAD-binding protein [Haloferax mediterranei]AFK20309.1 potassium channel-like protein [Haloferax mediterranei ATCC 33500]AHZ23678.1 potassium channel protein [Haloferax mediterranei ATCC 33500]ELZ99165.1 potassium channel-like protein [Haloferax mediterranei ATCC 33500]MDX5986936.1 NAD-binding protein [Haloferax mediterranei ATCC 33500]QCQ76256.1 potassium channel protein [Haloferax mediterranei ATCC 33500]